MLAAVHIDDSPHVRATLEHKQNTIGQLVDLKRKRGRIHARDAGGQAESFRIVLGHGGVALVVLSLGPRKKRNVNLVLWLGCAGETAARAGHISHTWRFPGTARIAQVRMPVG